MFTFKIKLLVIGVGWVVGIWSVRAQSIEEGSLVLLADSICQMEQAAQQIETMGLLWPEGLNLVVFLSKQMCIGCYSPALRALINVLHVPIRVHLILIHPELSREEAEILAQYYQSDTQRVPLQVYWSKNAKWKDLSDTAIVFALYQFPGARRVATMVGIEAFARWIQSVVVSRQYEVVFWDTLREARFLAFTSCALDAKGQALWIQEYLPIPQVRIYSFPQLQLTKTLLAQGDALKGHLRSHFNLPLLHPEEQFIVQSLVTAPFAPSIVSLVIQRHFDVQTEDFQQRYFFVQWTPEGTPVAMSRIFRYPDDEVPSEPLSFTPDSLIVGPMYPIDPSWCEKDTLLRTVAAFTGLHWRKPEQQFVMPLTVWLKRQDCSEIVRRYMRTSRCILPLDSHWLIPDFIDGGLQRWSRTNQRIATLYHPIVVYAVIQSRRDSVPYSFLRPFPAKFGAVFPLLNQHTDELVLVVWKHSGEIVTGKALLPTAGKIGQHQWLDLNYLNTIGNVHYFLVKLRTPERFHWIVFGVLSK